MKKVLVFFVLFMVFLSLTMPIGAEENGGANDRIKVLEEKLQVLQRELEELKQKQREADEKRKEQAQKEEEAPKDEQPSSAPAAASSTNPNISLIGELIWKMNHNKHVDGGSPFQPSNVELAFQSNIDPFSRADVFLHYHDDHLHVCEGYATLYKVPFSFLQTKAGKFKTCFGKVNAIHHHEQPWIDEPNMITNFFGGEGIAGQGLSMKSVIPTGDVYTELVVEGFNDENSRSFSGGTSGIPLYNGHLKAYADLNDESNIELGVSHLRGYNNAACTCMTAINGADVTYRWRPAQKSKYNSLLLRGEALFSQRNNPGGQVISSKGFYGFGQYQLNRNWYVGGRYDYSEFPDLLNSVNEKAWSGILTYYPSEFMTYRLQYKNTERSYASRLQELWLQLQFNIGPHGAHDF
ncbi:MAG: hypothetical protein AB9903_11380 [Vulcanimicrobiota bacterium]